MIQVLSPYQKYFSGIKSFDDFFSIAGEEVKAVDNRSVRRFVRDGEVFYIKAHEGIGWKEILKNWSQLKAPVVGAENEWRAIRAVHRMGLHTMEPVAFGRETGNPAEQRSFLITKDFGEAKSLEQLTDEWQVSPPSSCVKRKLIEKVATVAKTLHQHGVNHRDFYLCHLLLSEPVTLTDIEQNNFKLLVIDLHRAQLRPHIPLRWLVKDVASLWFSSMHLPLSDRDRLRFVRHYAGLHSLRDKAFFWRLVKRRAERIHQREQRKRAQRDPRYIKD